MRQDAYPEDYEYTDTGCDLAPSCLRCPFERCRFDTPPEVLTREKRIQKERQMRAQGMSDREIAAVLGLSRRTIVRDLQPRQTLTPSAMRSARSSRR